MLVLSVVCVGLSLLDDRTLNGVSVWSKPLKFSLSLAVYFATMAWFAPLLPTNYFATTTGRTLTWVPIVSALAEMLYILLQAVRGEASHFNVSTPFHATMYTLMAAGATLIVAATLWMGLAILHRHRWRNPIALAVGLGFVLAFLLGGGFGFYLGGQTSHWVGGTSSDANGLWLLGWTRNGGDLRVAHFFGMHAMQAIPMFALLLPASWTHRRSNVVVVAASALYTGFTVWTFLQAVQGQAFLP